MVTHKFCTLCGRELPLSMFPTNRGMADGHLSKCFECWALFTSDRERIVAVAEHKQAKMEAEPPKVEPEEVVMPSEEVKPKPKRKNKPMTEQEQKEQRVKRCEYMRDYYQRNKEHRSKYQRDYYHANKEKTKAWKRKYDMSDKGKEVANVQGKGITPT